MKTLEELAKKGEQHDVMDALTLLTKAYILMCGYSLGFRTVVYCAGEAWQERLAWQDLPLSEKARKSPLFRLMPDITSEYAPDFYDEYDIAGMSKEEMVDVCRQIVQNKEFDEPTTEVLCWGVLKCTEKEQTLAQEVKAVAPDGTLLEGILTEQSLGATCLSMTSPYNTRAMKMELVRDAKELLVETYEEYQRLHNMESEIRALFSTYQEEVNKLEDAKNPFRRYSIFRRVYEPILHDTVLFPDQLFQEWFGLKFNIDWK